jgi:light-regulated signal transduction histidine kinase (bacteriophytochrome)
MTSTQVDLTNCDREPIHQPGAIQQHGVLVVCDAETLAVSHVSENVATILGIEPAELIGSDVLSLFAADARGAIEQALRSESSSTPVYLHTVQVRSQTLDAITHRSGDHLFLEFEPAQQSRPHSAPELYRLVQHSIMRLFRARSVAELAKVCAEQVRQLSKFDRVMVYQFDHEWNGSVIAEEKQDNLEPFVGLHYPASDIPAQARELYTRNCLRFIANRDYVPSRIVPEVGPDSAQPLDMSFSVLRSVSPIHLEYLRNMGVGASMFARGDSGD